MSNNRRPVNRVTPGRRKPGKVAGAGTKRTAVPKAPAQVQAAVEVEDAVPADFAEPSEGPARQRFPLLGRVVRKLPRPGGRTVTAARLPIVLGVAAAVLAAFAIVAAFKPGGAPSNMAYVDGAATEEVKAAAKQALITVYGYDAATIDGWPAQVHKVLTGDMARDFDKTAKTTIDAVKQSDTKTDVQVDPVGVTLLANDQAEVLADVNVSSSRNGSATGSVAGPIILRMSKIGGRWLASHVASTYMIGQ